MTFLEKFALFLLKSFPQTKRRLSKPLAVFSHSNSVCNLLPIDKQYAENIRNRRDTLIKESDWRAVSDRKLEPEWKEYRQALRDITEQEGFPHDVEWPVDPDGKSEGIR